MHETIPQTPSRLHLWSAGVWGFMFLHAVFFATVYRVCDKTLEVSWFVIGLTITTYVVRGLFGVAIGYHRYFSHRSFKFAPWCKRPAQFLLAFIATSTHQRGVIWWAKTHRDHHKYSDEEGDHHSPVQNGFWYSHIGWIFDGNREPIATAKDLERYKELVILEKLHWIPGILLGALCLWLGGFSGLLIGYFSSTVAGHHATFLINSVAHIKIPFSSQRYETGDQSQNSPLMHLVTFGEGSHNNHHYDQVAARQGERWWEIDLAYYTIWAMEKVGIIARIRTGKRGRKYVKQPQVRAA